MFDENIGSEQIIEPGGTICIAAKYVGDKKKYFFSEWDDGKLPMLEGIHALMSEADAIVTYNGDKFDLPVLTGEFVLAGMNPPPPVTSIDVYRTVRGFRLGIHKLGYVGPLLQVGAKVKHAGFGLWKAVMAGDPKARATMRRYNIQDVVMLEKLYLRVLPFIKNHPHMGSTSKNGCPACSSTKVQSRGFRRTRCFKIQRLQCQDCGSWHQGTRTKV